MNQEDTREPTESMIRPSDEFIGVSDEDLYLVMEFVPLPVLIADAENRYLFMNQPAHDFLDCRDENIAGKKMPQIFHARRHKSKVHGGSPPPAAGERFETELVRRDGKIVWGEVFASLLPGNRRQIIICDITERKHSEHNSILSEERRWQDQKYEALGKLAGGVAHELNNLLAIILLQTDILRLQFPPGGSHYNRVNEIKAVVDNAAGIVRQLLAFGRRQVMYPSLIVLNEVVTGFAERMPALINENIDVRLNLNPRLGACFVDCQQVENVLADLVLNAAAAMPEGGELLIETTNFMLDNQSVRHTAQPSGSYVQLSVTDNGIGMDSEAREHIFEPLFSTKQTDKNWGAGLATAYGIVKQLKGFIWVESEANQGTTFTIQFPQAGRPSTES